MLMTWDLGSFSFVEGAFHGVNISFHEAIGLGIVQPSGSVFKIALISGVPVSVVEGLPTVVEDS